MIMNSSFQSVCTPSGGGGGGYADDGICMVIPMISANELLEQTNPNNYMTRIILQLTSRYLDEYGALTWNLRLVAFVSFILLAILRYGTNHKYNVDWCALIHAIITTVGAFGCWYLDTYYDSSIRPSTEVWIEPLRSVTACAPPLTSLHRILPSILLGYSLLDLIHGIRLGPDFIFHGFITLAIMGYMVENNVQHTISNMLLMEGSTIFLSLLRAEFFNDIGTLINMALFVLSFFLFRCIWVPYLWGKLMIIVYYIDSNPHAIYHECFPHTYFIVILLFGLMFNCLNGFWMFKIVMKIYRKAVGTENVIDESDDLQTTNKDENLTEMKKKKYREKSTSPKRKKEKDDSETKKKTLSKNENPTESSTQQQKDTSNTSTTSTRTTSCEEKGEQNTQANEKEKKYQ